MWTKQQQKPQNKKKRISKCKKMRINVWTANGLVERQLGSEITSLAELCNLEALKLKAESLHPRKSNPNPEEFYTNQRKKKKRNYLIYTEEEKKEEFIWFTE